MNESSAQPEAGPPRLLITAGPTHEPIDAVRYIGNRSSGRMGIALAEQAAARAWPTTLLLGPTQLRPMGCSHLTVHRFQTAAELRELALAHWPQHDVLLMAAAVADYRPAPASGAAGAKIGDEPGAAAEPVKLRRTDQPITITLEPTPDLLVEISRQTRPDQTVIGFALEPAAELLGSAEEKLARKKVHAIVANPLETMDAETVSATLILPGGRQLAAPPGLAKAEFAAWLLDQVV